MLSRDFNDFGGEKNHDVQEKTKADYKLLFRFSSTHSYKTRKELPQRAVTINDVTSGEWDP